MPKFVSLPSDEPAKNAADAKAQQAVLSVIDAVLLGLGPAARKDLLRAVTERLQPIPVPQAGDVLGIVVQLIPRDRQFTVAELKESLERQGAEIPSKEIHNAVGYLARKGHITRLGYGKYVIDGMPIVTTDELGGQRSITEGDLDN